MERAYSVLTIKSIDEERRLVKGIATTPAPDRVGDVVEPRGAKFKLPIPFKWEHKNVIGNLIDAKVSEQGIEVLAKVAKILEPGRLQEEIEYAWQSIKAGLVRGLSIGIVAHKSGIKRSIKGGDHFFDWTLTEVSAVAIPANIEASILSVKSLDTELRAASGQRRGAIVLEEKYRRVSRRSGSVYLKD
jgi:hypothetical protein